MNMEAVCTYETTVSTYKTIWCHPEEFCVTSQLHLTDCYIASNSRSSSVGIGARRPIQSGLFPHSKADVTLKLDFQTRRGVRKNVWSTTSTPSYSSYRMRLGSESKNFIFNFLKKNVQVWNTLNKYKCFSSQNIMGQRGLLTFDDDVRYTSARRKQWSKK